MGNRSQVIGFIAFIAISLSPGWALAQSDGDVLSAETLTTQKTLEVHKSNRAPKIDGDLSDKVWQEAAHFEDFHQIEPEEFAAPSRRTEIWVTFTSDALYIAAYMHDEAPERLRASQLIHGSLMRSDDTLAIILDPFLSRRSGYGFFTNPNGVRREAIFENVNQLNFEWRGIWQVESRVVNDGWVTEIEIPFKTLNFNPNLDTWGFSAMRRIRRENEEVAWTSKNRAVNPSSLGTVSGLQGLEQGLGLDILPSLSFIETYDHTEGRGDFDTEPSVTAFYKITPSLTAVGTANTNFSDAPIDDRVVNLSRFALFLPEQRDFFLQDADIFRFGGIEGNGTPFFSRQIGLSDTGEPVQLNLGGKLTGRLGSLNLGVLDVIQSAHYNNDGDYVDRSNLLVGRASMNILGESTVGAIFTSGSPNSNDENMLGGVDFNYRNSNFFGKTLKTNLWAQQTATEGDSNNAAAYGLYVNLDGGQGLWFDSWYQALEDNYDPHLGFANWTGIHNYGLVAGYTFRFSNEWIRWVTPVMVYEMTRDEDWRVQSERKAFQPFWLQTAAGYEYRLRIRHEREVLDNSFEIVDGVDVSAGDYGGFRTNLMFKSPDSKLLSVFSEWDLGEFYGGHRYSFDTRMDWRPNKHFLLGLGYAHHEVDLPEGDFITRLATVRANVAFSTKWSWRNYIQYDNNTDTAGINTRVEFSPYAGRAFVFVFDQSLDVFEDWNVHAAETQGTFKLSYTLRY
ncbi:MAG: hypothetical protein EP347_03720 [Alphaproteobacteria bacterium]|nr:MAG: hypothetical protein EP347_03720 [Alphaproteobacteria bacterium]